MSRLKSRVFTGERKDGGGWIENGIGVNLMAQRQNHTLDVAPKHANPINRFFFGSLQIMVACS